MVVQVMVVQVSFRGNMAKLYDYLTDLDLQVGEPVVVPTGSSYAVGRVERLLESSSKATAWVVQRVDVAGHKRRMRLREAAELDTLLS